MTLILTIWCIAAFVWLLHAASGNDWHKPRKAIEASEAEAKL